MNWGIFITNILLHVGFMALFLTVFFFTFAQNVEKQIVEEQLNFVIKDFVGNSFKPLDPSIVQDIKHKIDSVFNNLDFTKQDSDVKKSNKAVFDKAITFVSILFGTILLFALFMSYFNNWDHHYIKYLITSCFSSLIFVAITETLFLLLIAKNYLSADPNQIKLKVVETLANNTCQPYSGSEGIGKKN